MTFHELITKRKSVRRFLNRPIKEQILESILNEIQYAPSAGNLQSYSIIPIITPGYKEQLVKVSYNQFFIATAPVVFIFCVLPEVSMAKYSYRGGGMYCLQDATIACAYAQLAIAERGLGSCWVGAFDETELCKILGLNIREEIPIAILPIGYPDDSIEYVRPERVNKIKYSL